MTTANNLLHPKWGRYGLGVVAIGVLFGFTVFSLWRARPELETMLGLDVCLSCIGVGMSIASARRDVVVVTWVLVALAGVAIVIVTLRERAERDRLAEASLQAFQLDQEVTRARAALCTGAASEALPAELAPAPSWVFRLDPRGEWRLVDELALPADVVPERVMCIRVDGPRTHAIATYDLVGHQLGFARLEDVTEAGLRDYVERSRQRVERLPPP